MADVPQKTKLLGHVIPGDMRTYIFNTEGEYYADYAASWFGITKRKAGWDCMRHYEILANGCIPVFMDLENCPAQTMTHLPKELIMEAGDMYYEMKKPDGDTPENRARCEEYIRRLLDYTRTHLTNRVLASYILTQSGHTEAKRVLYLSGGSIPDYMQALILVGLKQIMGAACHEYPRIPHIYTDCTTSHQLYGKGMSYTCLVDPSLYDSAADATLVADIKNGVFDLIIYSNYHRGMPLRNLVMQHYPASDILLICGEDRHVCTYGAFVKNGHHVFVRELKMTTGA